MDELTPSPETEALMTEYLMMCLRASIEGYSLLDTLETEAELLIASSNEEAKVDSPPPFMEVFWGGVKLYSKFLVFVPDTFSVNGSICYVTKSKPGLDRTIDDICDATEIVFKKWTGNGDHSHLHDAVSRVHTIGREGFVKDKLMLD